MEVELTLATFDRYNYSNNVQSYSVNGTLRPHTVPYAEAVKMVAAANQNFYLPNIYSVLLAATYATTGTCASVFAVVCLVVAFAVKKRAWKRRTSIGRKRRASVVSDNDQCCGGPDSKGRQATSSALFIMYLSFMSGVVALALGLYLADSPNFENIDTIKELLHAFILVSHFFADSLLLLMMMAVYRNTVGVSKGRPQPSTKHRLRELSDKSDTSRTSYVSNNSEELHPPRRRCVMRTPAVCSIWFVSLIVAAVVSYVPIVRMTLAVIAVEGTPTCGQILFDQTIVSLYASSTIAFESFFVLVDGLVFIICIRLARRISNPSDAQLLSAAEVAKRKAKATLIMRMVTAMAVLALLGLTLRIGYAVSSFQAMYNRYLTFLFYFETTIKQLVAAFDTVIVMAHSFFLLPWAMQFETGHSFADAVKSIVCPSSSTPASSTSKLQTPDARGGPLSRRRTGSSPSSTRSLNLKEDLLEVDEKEDSEGVV